MMPPDEFAELASSSTHSRLRAVGSASSKTKRSGMDGCSHSVLRPRGWSSGCRHDTVKLSPRRSFVAMTTRSEEHTSELQSLMRISYAVFCLKKKNNNYQPNISIY